MISQLINFDVQLYVVVLYISVVIVLSCMVQVFVYL